MRLTSLNSAQLKALLPINAIIVLHGFTSDLASSLTEIKHNGYITDINSNNYCKYLINSVDMPSVHISSIEIPMPKTILESDIQNIVLTELSIGDDISYIKLNRVLDKCINKLKIYNAENRI